MTIGRIISSAGGLLAVALVGLTFYACNISDDGRPIVLRQSGVTSPDGRWIATLESVDNGLGFGLGLLYHEIHISQSGESIFSHGDNAKSSIFYIDATSGLAENLRVGWQDSTHLVVSYEQKLSVAKQPGKCLKSVFGISIKYKPACRP
jgi:hypothetical protein